MKSPTYNIAFFGSSLVSAYWNGAATYYRGLLKALHELNHRTTFFEPDAFDRQKHRDIEDPEWAEVVVYQPTEEEVKRMLAKTADYDIIVKASGVGVFDELLEEEILNHRRTDQRIIFWDVDAPATLASMTENPGNRLKNLIPEYDLILTYGGGQPVVDAYEERGAVRCIPVNNGLDPDTHHPVKPKGPFSGDLGFLGNRLPDREARMEEFFFSVAEQMPAKRFLLGGNGWTDRDLPANVIDLGHVYTRDHNAFNSSPKAVLNINRESMAKNGFSPATRVFEATGAGACLITDAWEGIDLFFEPGKEILVAESREDVIRHLEDMTETEAERIGRAARKRALKDHTYKDRALQVEEALNQMVMATEI